MKENSQQLVMSSLPEMDISQNSYQPTIFLSLKLMIVCSILVNLCVAKKEVGNISQIVPHIIRLLKFCLKRRMLLYNQISPFCNNNFFKDIICFMKNFIGLFQTLLVVFLKKILAHLYMMRRKVMYKKGVISLFFMMIAISRLKTIVYHLVFPHLNI